MKRLLASLLCLLGLLGCGGPREPEPVRAAGRAQVAAETAVLRRQPKPGERVRQPELDGYCADSQRATAFYYHGGSPVVRVARQDGCAPLYITECESEARCYPPRDQEPGMWCCAAAEDGQAAARAAR